jgi:HAD superfamily hydrolase (TIGR01509 family)
MVAFIFDMDGVIIDSNPFHKVALKQFCQKYGHDLSEEELKEKIYGRTNKDWIANVFGKLDDKKLKAYADEKEALFRKLYEQSIHALTGLINFLDATERIGIPCAIATSAPRANVDFTLNRTGIEKYFPVILDESFVSKGKPDPEIYIKTVAALGLEPEMCVVFEDSLSGVEAGKRAGCKVVGLATTHTAEELSSTKLVINDFSEIDPKTLISKLF